MFGICNLGIVPIRSEASDKSEMVSQLLFGEAFKIIESSPKWTKIVSAFDAYEGWIDSKQFQKITENQYHVLEKSEFILNGELIDFISYAIVPFIDSGISMELNFNLNNPEITPKYISETLQLAWEKECKTIYYVRSVTPKDKEQCIMCSN